MQQIWRGKWWTGWGLVMRLVPKVINLCGTAELGGPASVTPLAYVRVDQQAGSSGEADIYYSVGEALVTSHWCGEIQLKGWDKYERQVSRWSCINDVLLSRRNSSFDSHSPYYYFLTCINWLEAFQHDLPVYWWILQRFSSLALSPSAGEGAARTFNMGNALTLQYACAKNQKSNGASIFAFQAGVETYLYFNREKNIFRGNVITVLSEVAEYAMS